MDKFCHDLTYPSCRFYKNMFIKACIWVGLTILTFRLEVNVTVSFENCIIKNLNFDMKHSYSKFSL